MGEPPGDINVAIDNNERLRRMYYQEAPPGHQKMRLGYAVGSSACVPGVFTPLRLKNLYPDRDVLLVDGGVHDNQGTASLLEQGLHRRPRKRRQRPDGLTGSSQFRAGRHPTPI